jgi:hypothetical protein
MNFSSVSLTKTLVEMHEGESMIESEEKKGTDVIVHLPKSWEASALSNGGELHSPDGESMRVSGGGWVE